MQAPPSSTATSLDDTDALFQANLDLIARCWPSLHSRVAAITKPHTTLVRVGDDDWDVEFRGNRFYGKGSRAAARAQVAEYMKAPRRFNITPPDSQALDRFTNSAIAPLLQRAVAAGATFEATPQTDKGWHLIVFGWGLGDHIIELLERTGAHNLIVVEPNMEMVLHSLRTFDWRRFVDDPSHLPLTVTWMFDDLPPNLVAVNIRANLRNSNVAGLDGSYTYQHYPNTFLQRIHDELWRELAQAFKGLGYIDDELKMIRNTSQNVSSDTALLFRRHTDRRNWPIFVIGSGPSLDGCLDVIRANQDRALIIACGTALPPLIKAGIRPDFFAELENSEPVFDWIARVKGTMEFDDVICVASDTVDGRIKTLFDRTVFFIRPGLASTPLYGSDEIDLTLQLMHPTVGNCGFSFALACGFREVYFFGLDLGSKHADRHHANFSPYETGTDIAYDLKMNISRKGNFGGWAMTDNVMDWSRDMFEALLLKEGRGKLVYNCSDGIYINGAMPKLPSTLKLPAPRTTREQELAAILDPWKPFGKERFDALWAAADLEGEATRLAEAIKELCVLSSDDEPLMFLAAICTLVAKTYDRTPSDSIYRGTLYLTMLTGAYFVSHCSAEHRRALAEQFVEELKALVDRMTDHVRDFLRGMRETGHYDLPVH